MSISEQDFLLGDEAIEWSGLEELVWTHILVHHTGAEEEDTEQIRRYHKSMGWLDIGYNFVIERDSQVKPGRPLFIPGAHCRAGGMNRKAIGVAVIGNLDNYNPPLDRLNSLRRLILNLRSIYRVPVANVLGHRQVPDATDCPGKLFPMGVMKPLHLVTNGRVLTTPMRYADEGYSEMLLENGQWVKVTDAVLAMGGNYTWREGEKAVEIIF